jgi:hypothetical protein
MRRYVMVALAAVLAGANLGFAVRSFSEDSPRGVCRSPAGAEPPYECWCDYTIPMECDEGGDCALIYVECQGANE